MAVFRCKSPPPTAYARQPFRRQIHKAIRAITESPSPEPARPNSNERHAPANRHPQIKRRTECRMKKTVIAISDETAELSSESISILRHAGIAVRPGRLNPSAYDCEP